MKKAVDKLSNFDLIDEYTLAVKYRHYDPLCAEPKDGYDCDELRRELQKRLDNARY